jgi:hypothetical protein
VQPDATVALEAPWQVPRISGCKNDTKRGHHGRNIETKFQAGTVLEYLGTYRTAQSGGDVTMVVLTKPGNGRCSREDPQISYTIDGPDGPGHSVVDMAPSLPERRLGWLGW